MPAIRAAAQNGLHDHAWRIAAAWGPYLDMRAGFDDWNGSHQQGLLSAIACGDRRGEAIMHRNLGQLALYQDDWDTARRHLDAAARLFAEVGDRLGEGIAAVGLGTWLRERGRPDEGLEQYEKAIEAFVEVGNANAEALARTAAANIWLARNDTAPPAATWPRLSCSPYGGSTPTGRRRYGGGSRHSAVHQGRHDQAVRQLRTALAIFNGMGDDHCAAYTRADLGHALMERGEVAAARKMLLDAIDIGHRLGDRSVEGQAAQHLGAALPVHGQPRLGPPYSRPRRTRLAAGRERRPRRRMPPRTRHLRHHERGRLTPLRSECTAGVFRSAVFVLPRQQAWRFGGPAVRGKSGK